MSAVAYIYILASRKNGTLYVGMTNCLIRRMYEHRMKPSGFVRRYAVYHLVYFERHELFREAVQRERNMKQWRRDWKIAEIEKDNPLWHDLAVDMVYVNEQGDEVRLGDIRLLRPLRGMGR